MADQQVWVTSASNDIDGLKSVALGKSLRLSMTTRKLLVFISAQISEGVRELLENEFDICLQINKIRCDENSDRPFSDMAKIQCSKLIQFEWFVFVDCNCLVLKNSDELFKQVGVCMIQTRDGEMETRIAAGRPGDEDDKQTFKRIGKLQKSILKTGRLEGILSRMYCTPVDLLGNFTKTGKEIKIVSFSSIHPMELIASPDENLFQEMDEFQQGLVYFCRDLFRGEKLFGDSKIYIENVSGKNNRSTRSARIITASAESLEILDETLEALKQYLKTTNNTLYDIEYTTHVTGEHSKYRVAFVGETKEEIAQQIAKREYKTKQISSESPKICFLFTGSGCEYRGVAQELYQFSAIFKYYFDNCEKLLKKNHGLSLKQAVWGDTEIKFNSTFSSHASIFCIEYCLLKLWESWGITPDCVLGHSLGEFAAAVAADIIPFEDALKLVTTRSKLCEKLPVGKMLAVEQGALAVERLIKRAFNGNEAGLDVVAKNTEKQTVVAGDENAIRTFSKFCEDRKMKTHVIETGHAFYSRQMDAILDEYKEICSTISFYPPSCEFISGMEGRIMNKDEIGLSYWIRHIREKSNFLEASKSALKTNGTIFIEIGTHPVLSAFILTNSDCPRSITTPLCLQSLRKNENEWMTMLNSLSALYVNGVNINWKSFHLYSRALKVNVPNYMVSMENYSPQLLTPSGNKLAEVSEEGQTFWLEYDSIKSTKEKANVVRRLVLKVLCKALNLEGDLDAGVTDDAALKDLGVDSLAKLEIRNKLQIIFGERYKITLGSLKHCETVGQLINTLFKLVSGAKKPTQKELIQLIKEDSKLPDDIRPVNDSIIPLSEIRTVFITGVTGNFGPYVLRELSKRQGIEKIYCIVRENKMYSPKERLTQMLEEKRLLGDIDMDKVECLAGDVAKPLMGLNPEIYSRLTEEVDAIFNLSVRAALLKFYCKTEASRPVNVFGTLHVLKFACDKKTKHVLHASSTLSNFKLDKDGYYWESWPVEGEFDNVMNSAYMISKFIGDRLIAQAVERGIPCKAFRYPYMAGDSVLGGNISILNNYLMMKMIVYMFLGMMPATRAPVMIIPVDACAEISLRIFFDERAGYEIYNMGNPFTDEELGLPEVALEFGYNVEVVELEEFYAKIKILNEKNKSVVLNMISAAASREEDMSELHENPPEAWNAYVSGNKNVFYSQKLAKYIPEYPNCFQSTWEILRKDLQFAKESGIFAMVGLK